MKTFDAAILTELAKAEAHFVWLLDITIGGTDYRWTDADITLWVDGERYLPAPFSIGQLGLAAGLGVSSVQVSIANTDHTMRWIVLDQELRGTTMTIGFAALDADAQVLANNTAWSGLVSTYRVDDREVEITLVNELAMWRKKPLRQAATSCRWPFKGDECGYSGSETACDRTYTRCQVLGNTDNFGGFRFLTEIVEQQIYWGRYG